MGFLVGFILALSSVTVWLPSVWAQHQFGAFAVKLGEQAEERRAMLCAPKGQGRFPTIVFNHGSIVDGWGWPGATQRGYRLDSVCEALAGAGYLVFAPIRENRARGKGFQNFEEAYPQIVSQALDHAKSLPGADPTRVALVGFSMGGLTSFIVAQERRDLRATALLAPAFGRGILGEAAKGSENISAPVLVMVEASDEEPIQRGVAIIEKSLRSRHKAVQVVRHNRGGGHELFYDVGYWFDDLKKFLSEQLARN